MTSFFCSGNLWASNVTPNFLLAFILFLVTYQNATSSRLAIDQLIERLTVVCNINQWVLGSIPSCENDLLFCSGNLWASNVTPIFAGFHPFPVRSPHTTGRL